jgi:hypothetical protein
VDEDGGIKTVDGVEDNVEPDSDILNDFLHAQHSKRRAHERVFPRHTLPCVVIDGPTGRFTRKQQAEGQSLREGCGEERLKPGRVVPGRLRMGVKHLAKFITHRLQGRTHRIGRSKFPEPVGNDAAHQPRRMRQVARQLFRILHWRRVSESKRHQCGEKRCWIVSSNQALCARVRRIRIERSLWYNINRVDRFIAPKKTRKLAKFEIAQTGNDLKRSNCCLSCGSRYRAGSPGLVGALSSIKARGGCPALLRAMSGLPIPGEANSGTTMS